MRTTEKCLKECELRINTLCEMVNTYSIQLGIGKKVNAEDWSDIAAEGLLSLKGGTQ